MSLYKTYMYASVQNALDTLKLMEILGPEEVGSPSVAPQDAAIFSDDMMKRLEAYADKAIVIPDFEAWMDFLEIVANELGLDPISDIEKLASVLNNYRVEQNLEPL